MNVTPAAMDPRLAQFFGQQRASQFAPRGGFSPAGVAGGAGIGHLLGSMLDSPRQAVAGGLMAASGNTIAGEINPETGEPETMKKGNMLPAIAGLLAGGAMGLTGFGAGLAVPVGGAVAGLAQALGNNIAPESFGNFSSEELMDTAGAPDWMNNTAGQTLLGMGMDPFSYGGGFLGKNPAKLATMGGDAAQMAGLGSKAGVAGDLSRLDKFAAQAELGAGATLGRPAPMASLAGESPDLARYLSGGADSTLDAGGQSIMARRTASPIGQRFPASAPPRVPGPDTLPGEVLPWNPQMAPHPHTMADTFGAQAGTNPMMPSVPPSGAPTAAMIPQAQQFQMSPQLMEGQLQSMMGYKPDVLSQFPDLDQMAALAQSPQYKQINQAVADPMRAMGWGQGQRGALPPYAQMRGGNVMPRAGQTPMDPYDMSTWLQQPY